MSNKSTFKDNRKKGFMTWLLVKLSDLFSVFLPPNLSRYKDESSYSEWQFHNAQWTHEKFFRTYGTFKNNRVIDMGCGNGGKTQYYASLGPETIVGIDIDIPKILEAKEFRDAREQTPHTSQFVVGSADRTPFREGHFDLCISEDGFEHFPSPDKVLDEANRILKTGGRFFIVFDPYYGAGGPHLYNWIRLPWAHFFFSDRTMTEAARIIAKKSGAPDTPYRKRPEEQVEKEIYHFHHFINKITLRRFKNYLYNSPNWRLVCSHRYCYRKLFCPLIFLPFIDEMFTSVFCVLEKAPGQEIGPLDFQWTRTSVVAPHKKN